MISIANSKLNKAKVTLGCFIGWGICCWRPSQQLTLTMTICCTTDENLWLWSCIKKKFSVICFRLKILSSYASSWCLKLQMQIWLVPLKQQRLISEDLISWNTIQKTTALITIDISCNFRWFWIQSLFIVLHSQCQIKGRSLWFQTLVQSDITLSSVSWDAKALEMIYTAIYLIIFFSSER